MDAERWRRVEALFHAALEHEEPARSLFLDEQCDGDAELRREVERWLAADQDAPAQLAAAVTDAVRSFHTIFPPGTRIGPYEIVALKGEGGMGSVYRARRNDDVFRKEVAIKFVKRGMDSGDLLRRFRRERQILAELEHPYIARVLDGGSTNEGLPYLVMEYVDGQNLLEYARQRQLELTERLHLFCQVCEAVAHAHEHQVVHRDLKPSNILVDSQAHPRLLDFGIAKLTATREPGTRREGTGTTGDMGMLTPRYASPEHVRGEPITSRSDVYSLGVILYELLTGCTAHPTATGSPAAILKAICEDDAMPPSRAAATSEKFGASVPVAPTELKGDLDRIVLMALEKDPRRRYASAQALLDDLRRHLERVPVAARSRWADGAFKFVRRRRTALVVALLAVIALAAAYDRISRSRVSHLQGKVMLAALPLENLTGNKQQEYFVDGLHEEIVSRLGRLRPDRLGVIARTSTLQYKSGTKSIAAIGEELGVQYILEGSVRQAGDRVRVTAQLIQVSDQAHVWVETFEREFSDLFSVQAEIGAHVADSLELEVLPQAFAATERHAQLSPEALAAYLRGQYYWQRRWIEYPANVQRAIEHFRTVVAAAPEYAEGHSALAQSYQSLAWYGAASLERQAALQKAKEAVARALALDARLPSAHATLGTIRLHDWDWRGAERALREAVRLDPNSSNAHHYLGLVLAYTGRHGEADRETRVAEQLDPRSPSVHKISFWVYELGRRWDRAQDSVRMLSDLAPADATHVYFAALLMALQGDCKGARNVVAKRAPLPMESGVTDEEYAAAYILGRCGERGEMAHSVKRLEQRLENYAQTIAAAYAGARDRANTLRWLEESYRRREPLLVTLGGDPIWDFLRSEPRFQALVHNMALQQN
jgi:serine/threonine protein kinase/TolB-like protein